MNRQRKTATRLDRQGGGDSRRRSPGWSARSVGVRPGRTRSLGLRRSENHRGGVCDGRLAILSRGGIPKDTVLPHVEPVSYDGRRSVGMEDLRWICQHEPHVQRMLVEPQ
jgi:hypothetical protein